MSCSCRNFFIETIIQLQARFKFEDEFYNIVDMIFPINARQCNPPTLRSLFLRFPNLTNWCDRSKAELEWRSQCILSLEEIGASSEDYVQIMDPIEYWKIISNMKRDQKLRFPNLRVIISFLLSMPYSNASAERSFSALKLNKTKQRNSLKNETIVSLFRIKSWLKKEGKTAATVTFPDWLVNRVSRVRANKKLPIDS